jgi:hypothetical protein
MNFRERLSTSVFRAPSLPIGSSVGASPRIHPPILTLPVEMGPAGSSKPTTGKDERISSGKEEALRQAKLAMLQALPGSPGIDPADLSDSDGVSLDGWRAPDHTPVPSSTARASAAHPVTASSSSSSSISQHGPKVIAGEDKPVGALPRASSFDPSVYRDADFDSDEEDSPPIPSGRDKVAVVHSHLFGAPVVQSAFEELLGFSSPNSHASLLRVRDALLVAESVQPGLAKTIALTLLQKSYVYVSSQTICSSIECAHVCDVCDARVLFTAVNCIVGVGNACLCFDAFFLDNAICPVM